MFFIFLLIKFIFAADKLKNATESLSRYFAEERINLESFLKQPKICIENSFEDIMHKDDILKLLISGVKKLEHNLICLQYVISYATRVFKKSLIKLNKDLNDLAMLKKELIVEISFIDYLENCKIQNYVECSSELFNDNYNVPEVLFDYEIQKLVKKIESINFLQNISKNEKLKIEIKTIDIQIHQLAKLDEVILLTIKLLMLYKNTIKEETQSLRKYENSKTLFSRETFDVKLLNEREFNSMSVQSVLSQFRKLEIYLGKLEEQE